MASTLCVVEDDLGLLTLLLHLPVLGLQACITTPSLFHAGDSVQGRTHARQGRSVPTELNLCPCI